MGLNYLQKFDIKVPVNRSEEGVKRAVYIQVDQSPLGYIKLRDRIREVSA